MSILLLFLVVMFIFDIVNTKVSYNVFFLGELTAVILLLLFAGYFAEFLPFVHLMEAHILGLRVVSLLILAIFAIWIISSIRDYRDRHMPPYF